MLSAKVTFHRRMQRRWATPWCVLTTCLLLMGYTAFAWAQFPIPMPPGMTPPLFGAQQEGVDATADVVADFTLDRGFVLSGQITAGGTGIAFINGTVFAQSETEIYSESTRFTIDPTNPTAPLVQYRIVVPAGTYKLSISLPVTGGSPTSPTFLPFVTFDLQDAVVVTGDTEQNLVLPMLPEFFTVSGQIANPGDYSSEGGLSFRSEDGRVFNIALVEFPTEGAGSTSYSLTLPAGTYHVSYFPTSAVDDSTNPMPPDPEVSQSFLSVSVATVTVSADQVFDVVLPTTVTLSGLLMDASGISLAGAAVFATAGLAIPDDGVEGVEPPPLEPPTPTAALCHVGFVGSILGSTLASTRLPEDNTMGHYEMPLVPQLEAYQVGVLSSLALLPPATVPPGTLGPQEGDLQFPLPPDMITIMADDMRDFTLPAVPDVVVVSGRVTDGQGQPVSNAQVTAISSMLTATPSVQFSNGVETNEMGTYQLLVLSGVDYTVTVCPPVPSGLVGIPIPIP